MAKPLNLWELLLLAGALRVTTHGFSSVVKGGSGSTLPFSLVSLKPASAPVYIASHKLAAGPFHSFEELAEQVVGKSALLGDHKRPATLDAQRFRIYLDGLDEVPGVDRRRDILRSADAAAKAEPNVQLVITSRDYLYDRAALSLPTLRLTELDATRTEQLISRWLEERPTDAPTFHNHPGPPVVRMSHRSCFCCV
jgi:hypothetical protein